MSTVSAYAMATVASSSLPAPLPMSAMAGVTRPMIISGMTKLRNWLNTALKVTNTLTTGRLSTLPSAMPRAIAMITLGSRPSFIFFIIGLV